MIVMKNDFVEKYDILFSELLVPISIAATGLSLYFTLEVSLVFAPYILVSGALFGYSCMGLKRLSAYFLK